MNNLSQRERTLALMMLAVVPIVLGFFGWKYYQKQRTDKLLELQSALSRQNDLQDLIFRSDMEMARLDVYKAASLPMELAQFNDKYQLYVLDLIRQSGLELDPNAGVGKVQSVDVHATEDMSSPVLYEQIQVKELKVRGSMEQLTRFLHAFHDPAILQRIDSLVVIEVANDEEDTELKIDLNVSGIVLTGFAAPDKKAFSEYLTGRAGKSLEDLENLVVARNVFGPPNEAPEISSGMLDQSFTVGDTFRISNFAAKDSQGDLLDYELLESELEGVTLESRDDGKSAKLNGPKLDKVGRYRVKVRVADRRIPSLPIEETIMVNVEEPKQREVRRDPPKKVANETYITSILQNKDGEFIIRLKNEDDRFQLKAGESFELDGSTWKIQEVRMAKRRVVIQRDDEESMIFKLGSNLDEPLEEPEDLTVTTGY